MKLFGFRRLEMKEQINKKRSLYSISVRVVIVAILIHVWLITRELIRQNSNLAFKLNGEIGDKLLDFISPLNQYVREQPDLLNFLLISSSFLIDAVSISLLLITILGTTFRPIYSMLLCFMMRRICQLLIILPIPVGMLWKNPGFPSIFVTYDVSNDFFFSGHTSLAVLGSIELMQFINHKSRFYFIFLLSLVCFSFFEIATILILKAHWTMDIFTGVIVASYCSIISKKIAKYTDKYIP